ncbi:hypothetical protein ATY78_17195 [Rhizobium sp. R635]|uniref:RhuM family protein n=1 Tax=Rhizobium sp. R635 TaxID=1764275 RepID=UPI000B530EFA|nr:RhuM family protein [Rhizobium sp. R635]OWV90216.1 hypothetical protein ATY78_17195 [Rhizobium sp. R635]
MAKLINKVVAKVTKVAKAVKNTFDAFANFKTETTEVALPVDFEQDTVWATQAQMAKMFDVTKQNISLHLQNLFTSGELDESVVAKESLTTGLDGASDHIIYNLDAILAVGFQVNSKKAIAFRKWASEVLKGYIQDGYALNGKKLASDPAALMKLAQEVRAIRTSEKSLYAQVKETFVQCAIDYDKDDPAARTFFSTSQNVFHFAASEQTAAQIILERADASKPNMGMTAMGNRTPTSQDITVAKNYCTETELKKMQIVGESWLLYAEGMALQGKQVSMDRLLNKLTDLVAINEFPVFPGYKQGGPSRADADKHAKEQYELFRQNEKKQLKKSA